MNSNLSNRCLSILTHGLFRAQASADGQPKPRDTVAPRRLKRVFLGCFVDQAFFGPVKRGMRHAAEIAKGCF